MTDLGARAAELDGLWPQHTLERWFLAIAEESGEVVGAFNKWSNGYTHKPKTKADVIEEMAQLLMCLICAAMRLGYSVDEFFSEAEKFTVRKVAQIKQIREAELLEKA